MKIVFSHDAFTMQRYGGISHYFYELGNAISRRARHDVEVFAPVFDNPYLVGADGIRVTGLHLPRVIGTSFARRPINDLVSRSILSRRRGVDIFHETYYSCSGRAPPSAKRIVTVYDMIHELYPRLFPAGDTTHLEKRSALDRADHIICISENTRDDLLRIWRGPAESVSVVHLASSTQTGVEGRSSLPTLLRPYILFVGQRASYKNFERLLTGFAGSQVLRQSFALVCFGGGEFTETERRRISFLGFGENDVLQLAGDDRVLAGLYASAAVFVYPSLYEGFGMPPLEAMSLGCPVACSDSSSLPEVVGDAAELFDPSSEFEMISAVERVLTDPARAKELALKGLARVKSFSWDKCASETLAIYEAVLAGRPTTNSRQGTAL